MGTTDAGGDPPSTDHRTVARSLYDLSRHGGVFHQPFPDPATLDSGLGLQLDVLSRWESDGDAVSGWKVGLTSGRARNSMGQGFRPFGYLLVSRTFRSGDHVPLDRFRPAGIEPELAFRIDTELAGRDIAPEDVAVSIGAVAPAFELQQDRLPTGSSHALQLGDDLGQWGVVLGQPTPWARTIDSVAVTLRHDGAVVAVAGPGFAIDDPCRSIASMAGRLNGFGRTIRSGEWVITGAFHKATNIDPGTWTADFLDIGAVTVTLS